MPTWIRFAMVMVGGQMTAFSSRLVHEGHFGYVLGIALGVAFIMGGALLYERQNDNETPGGSE